MKNEKQKGIPVIDYLPYSERTASNEYKNALQKVLKDGMTRKVQFHDGTMRKFFGIPMEFPMKNGFPLITERKISEKLMRCAIAEIIGFIHGATTLSELESFGLPKYWWERWTELSRVQSADGIPYFNLPENDKGEHLGRFSYGGIWGHFPTQEGGEINQWENVIKQMIKSPTALTHRVTNWYPPGIIVPDGKRQVVVAPCHGDVQIDLDPENKLLTLIHLQRSADIATGVPWNMIHYGTVGMMLSCVLEYTFDMYKHIMIDAHIYMDKQEANIKKMLQRESYPFPTVTLEFETTGDPIKDFFAIRPEHFHLANDYQAHPYFKIDTEL